ncbi:hypothetical protein SAMN06296241_1949 [Salinimicrobium sediminis]|uniref:Uncharacterized protein n=1 Tax=Salinimicrobium sediminis TaxID=1343891 RepID=A0A285X4Y5_9FLAO|nr:hypothetical protein SAMN06296241_1949 [Salinimicrobium sediminis]
MFNGEKNAVVTFPVNTGTTINTKKGAYRKFRMEP